MLLLAASVFHFGEIPIPDLKQELKQQQIAVRIYNAMELNFSKTPDGLLTRHHPRRTTKTGLDVGLYECRSLRKDPRNGSVTFYSRSKQRLWTKGEESGNHLKLVDIKADCDQDTLLIQANPKGLPVTREPIAAGEQQHQSFWVFVRTGRNHRPAENCR